MPPLISLTLGSHLYAQPCRYSTKVHPTANHAILAPLRVLYLAGVPFQDLPDLWVAKTKRLLSAIMPRAV